MLRLWTAVVLSRSVRVVVLRSLRPAVSAPPDLLVGEADGYVDLPVSFECARDGHGGRLIMRPRTAPLAPGSRVMLRYVVYVSGTSTFAPGETNQGRGASISTTACLSGFRAFTFGLFLAYRLPRSLGSSTRVGDCR